jgi:flavodoxin
MVKQKILVVFYSRTGHTKELAKKISKELNADLDEVYEKKSRLGIKGFISGGLGALFRTKSKITFKKNPSQYDLVVIGTPIWSGNVCPAIRTYLMRNKLNKVAFFCSCRDKQKKAFKSMKRLSSEPIATAEFIEKIENKNKFHEFIKKLK